jgi:hypothetical protein
MEDGCTRWRPAQHTVDIWPPILLLLLLHCLDIVLLLLLALGRRWW